jgi:hypothetical protein
VRDAYNYLAEALYKVYAYFLLFLETFLNTYKVFFYGLLIGVSLIFFSIPLLYFNIFLPRGTRVVCLATRSLFPHSSRAPRRTLAVGISDY